MVTEFLEVELTLAAEATATVPDMRQLSGVGATGQPRHHNLSAIYYDTADLRLTRAKITLRRRTGGRDDGWHLKLPSATGRLELAAELAEPVDGVYEVPEELESQVRALVRDEELIPIAQVDNQRTETHLLAADDGHVVAEFCDDRVTAWSLLPGGQQTQWREWELELADAYADPAAHARFFTEATTLLIGAGARKSASPSKLRTALGDSVDHAPVPAYLTAQLEPGSAGAAVVAALRQDRDTLVAYDPRVRRDEDDAVHQMRVATRELRSHLQTFSGIVAPEAIVAVMAELKLLAGILGQARDAEVVAQRWQALLADDDSGLVTAELREHLATAIRHDYERAHRRIVRTLNSDRYLSLLDDLDGLLAHPPLVADAANQDIDATLLAHLDEARQRVRTRHRRVTKHRADASLSLAEREDYFHDMRKATKRLRYAAQAIAATSGIKTKRLVRATKHLQTVLGELQDSVTSRERLQRLAEADRRRGRDTFVLGMLYEQERARGTATVADYDDAYAAVRSAYRAVRRSSSSS